MLGNFPWDSWHIRRFSGKDIFISSEEVDERVFLFVRQTRSNTDHLIGGSLRIDKNFLGSLSRLEGPHCPLRIGHSFDHFLSDNRKFLRSDGRRGQFVAFHIALIGTLQGGADRNHSFGARHF